MEGYSTQAKQYREKDYWQKIILSQNLFFDKRMFKVIVWQARKYLKRNQMLHLWFSHSRNGKVSIRRKKFEQT
jgi:hypothetical protein